LNLSSEPYFKVTNKFWWCPKTGARLWMNFIVLLRRFYFVDLKPRPIHVVICERRTLSLRNSEVALRRTIAHQVRRAFDARGDT
jgi:hypothetical protein